MYYINNSVFCTASSLWRFSILTKRNTCVPFCFYSWLWVVVAQKVGTSVLLARVRETPGQHSFAILHYTQCTVFSTDEPDHELPLARRHVDVLNQPIIQYRTNKKWCTQTKIKELKEEISSACHKSNKKRYKTMYYTQLSFQDDSLIIKDENE